jgi:predicted Fe-Mo cluster-binding NifX family protein
MNGTRRIVVAAADSLGLDGEVSLHFGHSPAVVVIDVTQGGIRSARTEPTPVNGHKCGMAGFIQGFGAEVVIAGGMGPGAIQALGDAGVEVATGASGRIRDAVGAYLRGELGVEASCGHGPDGHGCQGHGH